MPVDKDKVYLALFSIYVLILVVATIGELFDVDFILDLVDVKRIFS
jgi:hypothetical protein